MDYQGFMNLHDLLKDRIREYIRNNNNQADQSTPSNNKNEQTSFHIPNGAISTQICLAAALRFFTGGSYLDMALEKQMCTDWFGQLFMQQTYQQHCNFNFQQHWNNVNLWQQISHSEAKVALIIIVLDAIDGMLLWTEKPYLTECQKVGVDSGKFYCGRKGKYGLNMQVVCDGHCRFTYVSVLHPASTSDYLAFVTSSLYQQLTEGSGLPEGYCLYGDNAYVSESYMAVPFPNTSSGPRDAYNYYHSQVCINIECDFGVLTNQWCLLKSPLSATISINQVNALVSCLCKIHNFCIDNGNATPPNITNMMC